jgi:predicted esterase
MLLGFSQGACLAAEFAARHPQKLGGVVGYSGGLIGPEINPNDYTGSVEQTRSFWDAVTMTRMYRKNG